MRIKAEDTMAMIVDYQESLMKVMYQGEELERNASILIQGLKALDIPMMITQQYTKGLGNSVQSVYQAAGTEEYLDKKTFSCWKDDAIARKIKSSGKKNIIICGIETHICVLQTCIDLKENGYQPILITDCVSSRKKSDKDTAISRAVQEGILVSTYESILFELLEMAGSDTFKTISKLIK
ncbi:hydrolase [Ruminococcus sp. OA3]|uniref:hydrolase n=1 Tax=Ruminococcus sp. OA3 TaxID=2914164 RepID=UPI001F0536AB|nr:hydrolase [Ruminococcus sp. OA3]MCH1983967.1 hydrolase [Ruminococcus sp. OA3]